MPSLRAINDSVASETDALELCSIAQEAAADGSLAFLHTPLDDRRARLAVFFLPNAAQPARRAAVNAPVLLGSMEWSVPKVNAINASASTALQWTRTGRNVDMVLCQRGRDPLEAAPIGDKALELITGPARTCEK